MARTAARCAALPGLVMHCAHQRGVFMTLHLPVGTLVFGEGPDGEELLADLSDPDTEVLVARGGRGGKGNEHFKSSTMRAPRFAQPGEPGEEKNLRLELKILADAGLLGLPNAGKSTFISRVSAARPKIAAYPFTTLTPNLGVMIDEVDPDRRMASVIWRQPKASNSRMARLHIWWATLRQNLRGMKREASHR